MKEMSNNKTPTHARPPRQPYLFPAAQAEVPARRRRRSYSGEGRGEAAAALRRASAALGQGRLLQSRPGPEAGPEPALPRGGGRSSRPVGSRPWRAAGNRGCLSLGCGGRASRLPAPTAAREEEEGEGISLRGGQGSPLPGEVGFQKAWFPHAVV